MGHEIDYSVFVGDLAYEVDDATLEQTFRTYYPSTKQAKVMVDSATGRSRGFGFVRFTSDAERDRAMHEMNGVFVGSKQIRVSLATRKPPAGSATSGSAAPGPTSGALQPSPSAPTPQPATLAPAPPTAATAGSTGGTSSSAVSVVTTPGGGPATQVSPPPSYAPHPGPGPQGLPSISRAPQPQQQEYVGDPALNPNNTTLFIGGLSATVSEAELHALFSRCGEIVYTKIPPGKGCGFVQFVARPAAEYALESLNGVVLGGMPIRVSWGRSSRPPGSGPPHIPSPIPPAAQHAMAAAGGYPPGAYGYAYDPYAAHAAYAAGGPAAYGIPYDPYYGHAAGAYGMDPYAAARGYAGYGMHAAMPGPHMQLAGAASGSHPGGPAPGTPGALQPMVYDPLAPPNVDKMNMAYMQRQMPMITGAYVRVPVAAVPMNQM